jgi:hypothetical protein
VEGTQKAVSIIEMHEKESNYQLTYSEKIGLECRRHWWPATSDEACFVESLGIWLSASSHIVEL